MLQAENGQKSQDKEIINEVEKDEFKGEKVSKKLQDVSNPFSKVAGVLKASDDSHKITRIKDTAVKEAHIANIVGLKDSLYAKQNLLESIADQHAKLSKLND